MEKQDTRSKKIKTNFNRKKVEGKSIDRRDGFLKQDKQINKKEEENFKQEKLEGDLSFTLSNFYR